MIPAPPDLESSLCQCRGGASMPKYVIEREIPGAGKLSRQELQAISQKSCGVLGKLGPQIQWVESCVTDDKIYCVCRSERGDGAGARSARRPSCEPRLRSASGD